VLATAICAALVGVEAIPVKVEADVPRRGLSGLHIVGMVETAVRESLVRIRSALKNCGYELPTGRVTVSLSPADMPKNGSGYDLAITLAILAASGVLPADRLAEHLVVGELSLRGGLRPVRGVLSYALAARREGASAIILPAPSACQAAAVPEVKALGAEDLPAVVEHLIGAEQIEAAQPAHDPRRDDTEADLADVRGQELARRALEIAAAGGHNVLMVGPPGTGKSMLAQRLPGILPPLEPEETLETSALWSVAGLLEPGAGLLTERPLRAPHHTASDVGVIGGGVPPRPGELSLAHNGVLFLDELPEFRRPVLEGLRQPLEQEQVVVVRASYRVTFPAKVMLVATMNPCPCGMFGDRAGTCTCTLDRVRRYRGRVSGPLLDRIDLHVMVPPVPVGQLEALPLGESSQSVRQRVIEARAIALDRQAGAGIRCNADLTPRALRAYATLEGPAMQLLSRAVERLGLSARGYDRVRKIARTIADLGGRATVSAGDVAEAVSFRALDRAPGM